MKYSRISLNKFYFKFKDLEIKLKLKLKLKYYKQIVDILYDEWNLGKKSSNIKGKTFAWIYYFEILEGIEQFVIEKQNNLEISI